MGASAEPTSTACSPTIDNALRGSSALAQVAQRSRTTHWLMKPWTGLRRILWPTSISIVCSAYRDERGGEHGNESDQDCVGATVKSERNPNIGGWCRIATGSHEGAAEADAVKSAGAGQRERERPRHCRFGIACVRRTVVTSIAPHRAPGGRCRGPFRYRGRRDDEQSREPRCRQVEQIVEACSRP